MLNVEIGQTVSQSSQRQSCASDLSQVKTHSEQRNHSTRQKPGIKIRRLFSFYLSLFKHMLNVETGQIVSQSSQSQGGKQAHLFYLFNLCSTD